MSRKENRKYTFSVEGQTEEWYLKWLEEIINETEESRFKVSLKATVSRSPMKFIKNVNAISTDRISHICDVEGSDLASLTRFNSILNELKEASDLKDVQYDLGYSNLAFELWVILHKQSCNGHLNSKGEYLKNINKAFGESFIDISDFKKEQNFKRCLSKLNLDDVRNAISRAESITQQLKKDGTAEQECKGYNYYKENPSLSIHLIVESMLKECGLL